MNPGGRLPPLSPKGRGVGSSSWASPARVAPITQASSPGTPASPPWTPGSADFAPARPKFGAARAQYIERQGGVAPEPFAKRIRATAQKKQMMAQQEEDLEDFWERYGSPTSLLLMGGGAMVFIGMCYLLGVLLPSAVAARQDHDACEAEETAWRKTTCTVTDSELKEYTDKSAVNALGDVWSYAVVHITDVAVSTEQVLHNSKTKTHPHGPRIFTIKEKEQGKLDEYDQARAVGTAHPCFYNPADPTQSSWKCDGSQFERYVLEGSLLVFFGFVAFTPIAYWVWLYHSKLEAIRRIEEDDDSDVEAREEEW